jgi:hypothetical protein
MVIEALAQALDSRARVKEKRQPVQTRARAFDVYICIPVRCAGTQVTFGSCGARVTTLKTPVRYIRSGGCLAQNDGIASIRLNDIYSYDLNINT